MLPPSAIPAPHLEQDEQGPGASTALSQAGEPKVFLWPGRAGLDPSRGCAPSWSRLRVETPPARSLAVPWAEKQLLGSTQLLKASQEHPMGRAGQGLGWSTWDTGN